jgi:hypothetical protein
LPHALATSARVAAMKVKRADLMDTSSNRPSATSLTARDE